MNQSFGLDPDLIKCEVTFRGHRHVLAFSPGRWRSVLDHMAALAKTGECGVRLDDLPDLGAFLIQLEHTFAQYG